MRALIRIVAILFILYSCKKEKTYKSFSEKELDFVNYLKGQNIRFIDTNNTTHTFLQETFTREFREFVGLYGKSSDFHELFSVRYHSPIEPSLGFFIGLSGKLLPYTPGGLNINFCDYTIDAIVDSLQPSIQTLNISGTSYFNVYPLKVYKYGWSPNNVDTATLFFNRQFGAIQLLLPNGKAFTRTN